MSKVDRIKLGVENLEDMSKLWEKCFDERFGKIGSDSFDDKAFQEDHFARTYGRSAFRLCVRLIHVDVVGLLDDQKEKRVKK